MQPKDKYIEGVKDAERVAARYDYDPSRSMEENGEEVKEADKTKSAKPKKKRSEKEKTIRALRSLIIKIAVVALLIASLFIWVGGISVSHDTNMYPAVSDGDLAILLKIGGYYNGDIVVYEHNGVNRFGRVVAIYGDVIDIGESGTYTVNGVAPIENIERETYIAADSEIKFPYTVQAGEVFVLNDYRENAYDSRVLGGIANAKGKVVLLLRRRGF